MTLLKIKQQPILNDNFNSAMENFFPSFSSIYRDEAKREVSKFVPVNIKETDDHFLLEVIAPGFGKEDFKINLDKNILTIAAEKKVEEKSTEKCLRSEYELTSVNRSFTLTRQVDVDAISAEYVNGVLLLNLPKKVEVKAPVKQISIN